MGEGERFELAGGEFDQRGNRIGNCIISVVRASDYDALASRVASIAKLIADHNDECQKLCGVGDQEAVACEYRPYFVNSQRRCPDCPVHHQIEVPEHLREVVYLTRGEAGE